MERGGREAVEVCSRCGTVLEVRRIRVIDDRRHEPLQGGEVRVIVRRVCPACLQTSEEQVEER